MAFLDSAALRRHRRRNHLHSLLVLAGIGGWMAMVGWIIAGTAGIVWAVAGAMVMLMVQPVRSVTLLRALFGAEPLSPAQAPGLCALVVALAERAGLERVPPLLYIPRRELVALSTGWGGDIALAVSDGMLAALSGRELAAVLAHEVSHLRHGDLRILRLAEAAGRLTRFLSLFGVLTVLFYMPVAMFSGQSLPILPVLLLVAAPLASDLLGLDLARTREFAADAGAVELTGDPRGLMAALAHIQRLQGDSWERLMRLPAWLSLIRTHPTTEQRLTRLAELEPRPAHAWLVVPDELRLRR